MVIFQASLPSVGKGSLKPRAGDGRILGTKDEFKMLNPADLYYKTQAVEFSRQQICCEIFVASSGSYSDIATLSCLSKYTGGGLNYYQNFHHQRDGDRLGKDIKRVLLRETAWESVARVRVTQGCRISAFYGNYYIRGADLLALPNCNSDWTVCLEITHDAQVNKHCC